MAGGLPLFRFSELDLFSISIWYVWNSNLSPAQQAPSVCMKSHSNFKHHSVLALCTVCVHNVVYTSDISFLRFFFLPGECLTEKRKKYA